MKYLLSIIFCIVLFNNILAQSNFSITFEQDGKAVEIINNEVKLNKKEFTIVFELSEPMGLLVNGSFDKQTYELALQNKPKTNLPGFEETGMAEGLLNADNDMMLSKSAPCYWFYDDEQQNRFNSVTKVESKYICKRNISSLFNIDNQKHIDIKKVNDPLYIVVMLTQYNQSFTNETEIQRIPVKLLWIK